LELLLQKFFFSSRGRSYFLVLEEIKNVETPPPRREVKNTPKGGGKKEEYVTLRIPKRPKPKPNTVRIKKSFSFPLEKRRKTFSGGEVKFSLGKPQSAQPICATRGEKGCALFN
jgi:hypothetical protein